MDAEIEELIEIEKAKKNGRENDFTAEGYMSNFESALGYMRAGRVVAVKDMTLARAPILRTLYCLRNHEFYMSTDNGKSWFPFSVPMRLIINGWWNTRPVNFYDFKQPTNEG